MTEQPEGRQSTVPDLPVLAGLGPASTDQPIEVTVKGESASQPSSRVGPIPVPRAAGPAAPIPVLEEHVLLSGRHPRDEFIRIMGTQIPAQNPPEQQWDEASAVISTLPALQDAPSIYPLPLELESAKAAVEGDPVFRNSFSGVPAELGAVDLSHVVVFQKTISLPQVERVKAQLGPNPSRSDVFSTCFPTNPALPVKCTPLPSTFYLVSESQQFMVLHAQFILTPQIPNYGGPGRPAGLVQIVFGYSANYVTIVSTGERHVLLNDSQRAYALWSLGHQQVPCVILKIVGREQLDAVAGGTDLQQNPDYYLSAPRPSLFKDYLDPRLHKRVWLPAHKKLIRIGFEQTPIGL